MTTQNPDLPLSIEEREFSTTRKGYDKREVRAFLGELENNFRELEQWAQDAKLRLQQAEYEAQKVKDEQGQSVDAAIAAVLEAKDRILERARKQATQIETDAQTRADEILVWCWGLDGRSARRRRRCDAAGRGNLSRKPSARRPRCERPSRKPRRVSRI